MIPNRSVRTAYAVAILLSGTSFCAIAARGQAVDGATEVKNPETKQDKDIIVTGVFGARAIENAPISINVVNNSQLTQHSAVSAADLLKNVPGVFVNSSLGEIRNVVFSRGISANSLDGQGGYYYVSMQEDGLPISLITATNYGPDYFLRPDLNLSRLEGLRGGTAAITGPNAPGGIFNYISKTGKSDPGYQIQGKVGLEGNVANPYYRVDAYAGGKLNDNGLYYSIGGFYRWDRGAHDPGYALNRGGQVHGNILYDYDKGSLLFTAKYLDDHNGWFEATPSYGATTIAPGFSNTSSSLPPANAAHCYADVGGGTGCWDPTSLVHSRSLAFGLNWKHDLGGGWHVDNKMRYTHSKADWNTGAITTALSLTDPIISLLQNTAFLNGMINYYYKNSGKLAATVNSNGSIGGMSVSYNGLPNQNLLTNGVFSQAAYVQHYVSTDFVDQATLTKDLGDHHLALGGYLALGKLADTQSSGGIGLSTLTNNPEMLMGTFTDTSGKVYQLTDSGGFTSEGAPLGNSYHGTQRQYSAFFGDTWKVTPRLTLDAGGRYEAINYDVFNQSYNSGSSSTGGADGNVLTLYDNNVSTPGALYRTKRSYHLFNYSASAAYEVSSHFNMYLRYTYGKKAPDFGTIAAINTPAQIASVFPSPQVIRQIEMGLKFHRNGVDLQFFPFYSHLTNVTSPQILTYLSGAQAGQFYSPAPVAGEIETYGVEISASGHILPTLGARANITLQQPKSRNFGSWTQGPKGDGTDDTLSIIAPGDADNNPKIIIRAGLDWQPVHSVILFGEVNYLGKRAANAANAFYLPAYTTVDIGGSLQVNDHVKLQLNVTNLFNTVGVMSWSRAGGFLASLDRQGLTKSQYDPGAIYPIVPVQPRALFLTGNVKF